MTITFPGTPTSSAGSGPRTCNKPTGVVNGDILLAFVAAEWDTYANIGAPAGWAVFNGVNAGTNVHNFKLFTKTAASEGSSYSFTAGGGADIGVAIVALRGVAAVADWLFAGSTSPGLSASRVAPSITGAGDLLLCAAVNERAGGTYTPPSGMTEQVDAGSTYVDLTVASLVAPPNPTTARTFTLSSAPSRGGPSLSVLIPAASDAVAYIYNGSAWVASGTPGIYDGDDWNDTPIVPVTP